MVNLSPAPLHLIVPMSGQGVRYQKAGYSEPKPLIKVNGRSMIERLLENFPESWSCTFILAENHRSTELPQVLVRLRPKAKLLYVEPHTQGPGLALKRAIEELEQEELEQEHQQQEQEQKHQEQKQQEQQTASAQQIAASAAIAAAPHAATAASAEYARGVMVTYCDYQMVWDPHQFSRFVSQNQCDACLVSYRGFHAHYLNPVTYAYSRMQGERVVEVKEKGSFTDDRENEFASCGAYYFKDVATLKVAIEYQYQHRLCLNGEYYTSLTVQALLLQNPKAQVRVFEIPYFFQWGTPEDLQRFAYWEQTMAAHNRNLGGERLQVEQVLMPMAGAGSRFKELTDVPKPFIPIEQVPMYQCALNSLPAPKKKLSLVALQEFADFLTSMPSQPHDWTLLPATPEGQALSTEAGLGALDFNSEVLVSSCDHAIALDPGVWKAFTDANADCDAAIFTIRGFPGCEQRPNAFAYVEASPEGWVKNVSVKKPLSLTPSQDALLVGTFWFQKVSILKLGIDILKNKQTRVNNELYLDSIFNLLIESGHRVREIKLDGYINWGDPDSYAEALYWQEVFLGRRYPLRARYPFVKKPSSN